VARFASDEMGYTQNNTKSTLYIHACMHDSAQSHGCKVAEVGLARCTQLHHTCCCCCRGTNEQWLAGCLTNLKRWCYISPGSYDSDVLLRFAKASVQQVRQISAVKPSSRHCQPCKVAQLRLEVLDCWSRYSASGTPWLLIPCTQRHECRA
jgi:hypothetical protein